MEWMGNLNRLNSYFIVRVCQDVLLWSQRGKYFLSTQPSATEAHKANAHSLVAASEQTEVNCVPADITVAMQYTVSYSLIC